MKLYYSLPTRFDSDGDKIFCKAFYEVDKPLPNFAFFKENMCQFIFVPIIENMGKHKFTVQLLDDNTH